MAVAVGGLVFAATLEARAAEGEGEVAPSAKTEESDKPRRTLLAEAALGVGTPTGWAGASLVLTPIEIFSLHGGVGLGSHGVQVEAGARGRFRTSAKRHLAFGAGWSTGQVVLAGSGWVPSSAEGPQTWFWRRAHLVNTDVSLEHDARWAVLRPFAGLGVIANADDVVPVNDGCGLVCRRSPPNLWQRSVLYFGVAVAFGVL